MIRPAAFSPRSSAPGPTRSIRSWLRLLDGLPCMAPGLAGFVFHRNDCLRDSTPALIYAACLFFTVIAAFSFNNLCDWELDRVNPHKEADRLPSRAPLAAALGAAVLGSAVGLPHLPAGAAWLLAAVEAACIAYSAPPLKVKSRPPLASVVHLMAGGGLYASGVLAARGRFAGTDLALCLFFALIVASAGLNNEIIDAETDRSFGLTTLAADLGVPRSFCVVVAFQLLGLACLAFLERRGGKGAFAPLALASYGWALRTVKDRELTAERLAAFHRRYRIVFALLSLAAVWP